MSQLRQKPAVSELFRPLVQALACGAWLTLAGAAGAANSSADEVEGPHAAPVDEFHPSRDDGAKPAFGGEIVIHMESMVDGLNGAIENSSVTRNLRYEVHANLILQDWEMWDYKPQLAKSWAEEDQLVLAAGAESKYPDARAVGSGENLRHVLFGKVVETDAGYRVSGDAEQTMLGEGKSVDVAKADVKSLLRGSVFTYYLRDNVQWHDGHPFTADDVYFSWDIYNNSNVNADAVRSQYLQILAGEVLDPHTVRFFFDRQYFQAKLVPGEICILPRHLYDLNDPDNLKYDPETHAKFEKLHGANYEFTAAELGDYINNNPHNTNWVGLGPYKIVSWGDRAIVAERFDGYFDKEQAGYLDRIVWRHIGDDATSFEALLNGELDYFARVKSADYFGEATEKEVFTETFYKGLYYYGAYGFTGMNTLRPKLADVNVRKALTIAFDWENYKLTLYKGKAIRVNGPQNYFGPGYNRSVEFLPYDPDLAEEMLAEAGWYDRDGDGVIDKDGIQLELEFLYPSGNDASKDFGILLQQAYEPLGIKLNLRNFEWATFLDRLYARNFDLLNLAWVPSLEDDPETLWHSKWGAADIKGSNMCGVMDEELDRLIEAGQIELDGAKRAKIWQAIHKRIYEDIHPYLFGMNSPRKYAMNKNVRGFQSFKISPGYSLRRWYYPEGTQGTRATLAK